LASWRLIKTFIKIKTKPPPSTHANPTANPRFDLSGAELQIFSPSGDRFLTFVELGQQRQQAETQLQQERQRRQVLEAKLREMGIDPNQP
jgi:hypothetical protein